MLIKNNEPDEKWYPTSIASLTDLLKKQIYQGTGFVHVDALRRNIAYNLQYLEFIHRCLEDLKLSSVILTQNIKMFIIVGCSIIESLLTFLLIKKGYYSQSEWKLNFIMPGQEKNWESEKRRIDCYVYKKLDKLKHQEMKFDSMLKKAESKKILGPDHGIYIKLNYLRKLRNKVHLQTIDDKKDTDWNAFHHRHICAMAQVIYSIFTSNIFRPSVVEKEYFSYLKKYLEEEIEETDELL